MTPDVVFLIGFRLHSMGVQARGIGMAESVKVEFIKPVVMDMAVKVFEKDRL